MDLKPVGLYFDHMGWQSIAHFGLGDVFHKIFSAKEIGSKYYYPVFFHTETDNTVTQPIPKSIIDSIKTNNCSILVVHPMEGFEWNTYDQFIDEICNIYGLSYDNFVALTCNPVPSNKYKSVFYNFWEFSSFGDNIIKEQHLGKLNIFKEDHRPYKFICLNRICHPHRWATVTALYPYKDRGLLSFANKDYPGYTPRNRSFITFNKEYPFYSKKFNSLNLPEDFKLTLPLHYEDPINEALLKPVIIDSYANKFYHSYLHIVCETFISHPFFTEKTYKPIKYFQPFVMINGQYSLQHFRDMGYQTFGGYIDESYDIEYDKERRIEMAIQAGLDFISKPNLHEVMKEMYPIFEHNHNVFIKRCRNFQNLLHSNISNILYAQDNNANQN